MKTETIQYNSDLDNQFSDLNPEPVNPTVDVLAVSDQKLNAEQRVIENHHSNDYPDLCNGRPVW